MVYLGKQKWRGSNSNGIGFFMQWIQNGIVDDWCCLNDVEQAL